MNVTVGVFASGSPYAQYYGAVGVVGSTGYTTSIVDNTYVLFDDKGHMYQVDSIVHIALGSTAYLYLNDLNSPASAPTAGKGMLCKRFSNGLIPLVADGSNYITAEQEAKILTNNMYYIDSLLAAPSNVEERFRDTVIQVSHGLSTLDPVFVNSSGAYIKANVSDEDSVHIGIVSEVITADKFIVTYGGLMTITSHGYSVGKPYFVQDDGSYDLTVESGAINDLAFTVITNNILLVHEQRPVSPSVDLNGIYSTSDTIPSGVISTASNWQVLGNGAHNYYINFNSDNDNISIRGDSVMLVFGVDGLIMYDYRATKYGIQYNGTNYVNSNTSLATKQYVDDEVAGIVVHPEVTVTDGTTIDLTISPLQVLTAEVISNSITASHIATGAVGSDEIATDAVGSSEIAADAVGSSEIATDAVGSAEIATSAVTTAEILDGTILTADLAFTPATGSGTLNYIPKWSSTTVLGNSSVQDDGVRVSFSSPFRMHNWSSDPGTALAGDMGYNSTNSQAVVYTGSAWNQASIPNGSTWQTLYHNGTKFTPNGYLMSDAVYNQFGGTTWLPKGSNTFYRKSQSTQGAPIVAFNATSVDGYYTVNSDGTSSTLVGSTSSASSNDYAAVIGVGQNDTRVIRMANYVGVLGVTGQTSGGSSNEHIGVQGQAMIRRTAAASAGNHIGVYGLAGTAHGNLSTSGTYYGVMGITRNFGTTSGTTGYGVYAESVNATTNWGFYNPTSAGDNALGGNTIVGAVTTPTATLDVSGSIRARAVATPASIQEGEFWSSLTQKAITIYQDGINQTINGVIFTGTANSSTITNTTTETSITPTGVGTLTLPTNFFVAGKTLRITVTGTYTTDAAAPTFRLRLKFGTTEISTFAANTLAASANGIFNATFIVTCRTTGASGTLSSSGIADFNSAEAVQDIHAKVVGTPTFNTTTSVAITVTGEFGTANANNTATTTQLIVEILN